PMELLVGNHSDNRSSGSPEPDLGADRFPIQEEASCGGDVDQRDRKSSNVVRISEQPATNELETYGLEVSWTHTPDGDFGPRSRLSLAPDDREGVGEPGIQRMVAGKRG